MEVKINRIFLHKNVRIEPLRASGVITRQMNFLSAISLMVGHLLDVQGAEVRFLHCGLWQGRQVAMQGSHKPPYVGPNPTPVTNARIDIEVVS